MHCYNYFLIHTMHFGFIFVGGNKFYPACHLN